MKKRIEFVLVGISLLTVSLQARPVTSVEMKRPTTSSTTIRPFTSIDATRPATSIAVMHPTTQTEVIHPQTSVEVLHPATQVSVVRPQTTVSVVHPQTTVVVNHPQTTVEVLHPQTLEIADETSGVGAASWQGGRREFSATAATSMSDFQPMQAKDLSAKPSMEKAAPLGGGEMGLGNETNQAEKDNVNKSSSIGEQKSAQNLDVDPKQNKLDGLEKLLTDRAKFQEKKQ